MNIGPSLHYIMKTHFSRESCRTAVKNLSFVCLDYAVFGRGSHRPQECTCFCNSVYARAYFACNRRRSWIVFFGISSAQQTSYRSLLHASMPLAAASGNLCYSLHTTTVAVSCFVMPFLLRRLRMRSNLGADI